MRGVRVLFSSSLGEARDALAALGVNAQLDDGHTLASDVRVVDCRGGKACPRSSAGTTVAWVDSSDVTDGFLASALGADDFVVPPITATVLLTRLRTARRESVRREAERLLTLGGLAAGIAHEINNPLGVAALHVEGAAGALERADIASAQKHLAAVNNACRRVAEIVGDLRLASRDPDGGPVDVSVAVATAVTLTRNEIRHRANLVRQLERTSPIVDPDARLVQVLVNVLLHAAQAITEGDAANNSIHVRTRQQGNDVVIEVSDTGTPRLDEDAIEPLVGAMNGRLSLDNEAPWGTTVRLVFAGAAPRRRTSLPTHGKEGARSLNVMLIDDEPDLRAVMVTSLASHQVTSCGSAAEALAVLNEGARFDAILCDVMMPDMTGMDFYAVVQAMDPEQARHMGFVTGGAFTERAQAFVEAHHGRILEKPFRLADLVSLVRRLAAATAPAGGS